MAKTIRTYSQWRQEKLTDPERAARYLTAAKRESRVAFQHAVKNVIQANQVTKIAKEVGVARESVYRSFSAEGNPAFYTIDAVLKNLGIEIDFIPAVKTAALPLNPTRTAKNALAVRRRRAETKRSNPASALAQVPLAFPTENTNVVKAGNTVHLSQSSASAKPTPFSGIVPAQQNEQNSNLVLNAMLATMAQRTDASSRYASGEQP